MNNASVTWPETPGWYWAFGRIAGMREAALMSAYAELEGGKMIVYVGQAMTHRLSFPDLELPLQYKLAVLPEFEPVETPVERPPTHMLTDDDGEVHESVESAQDFNRILRLAKTLPEYVWSLAPHIDFDKVVSHIAHPDPERRDTHLVVALRLFVEWIDGPISVSFERVVHADSDHMGRKSWADEHPDQSKLHALEMVNRLIGLGLDIDVSTLTDKTDAALFDPTRDLTSS